MKGNTEVSFTLGETILHTLDITHMRRILNESDCTVWTACFALGVEVGVTLGCKSESPA